MKQDKGSSRTLKAIKHGLSTLLADFERKRFFKYGSKRGFRRTWQWENPKRKPVSRLGRVSCGPWKNKAKEGVEPSHRTTSSIRKQAKGQASVKREETSEKLRQSSPPCLSGGVWKRETQDYV